MLVCLAFSALTIFNFLILHWDYIVMATTFLLYSVKQTRWGKANARALMVVTGAIERLDRVDVKHAIKSHSLELPRAVVDAIQDAVKTVDPKKPTPTAAEVVVREATRGARRTKALKE